MSMNIKQNFQTLQDEQLSKINKEFLLLGRRPKLALHSCCAPCSSYVLEYLAPIFDITVFYYNPNIYPPEEFTLRLEEQDKFIKHFSTPYPVKLASLKYNAQEFYDAIDIKNNPELANEAERGERCKRCYDLRLKQTAEFAKQNHIDFFTSTLSISPYKDALKINTLGKTIEKQMFSENSFSPIYLYSDFKKKNGFKRSIQISEEYGMYRQDYCGCIYSKINLQKQRDENGTNNSRKDL
jgi:predicted adenine nucleotide alpha hydrolase (AANH) superfamily ATPase